MSRYTEFFLSLSASQAKHGSYIQNRRYFYQCKYVHFTPLHSHKTKSCKKNYTTESVSYAYLHLTSDLHYDSD
jgi:hypothetical protein